MEKIFTEEFWQGIAAAVMAPSPWKIIPLLLFFGFIGWLLKGGQDSREIRGLNAENKALEADKKAAETRLKLAHDKQEAVTAQLQELEPVTRANQGDIAELKTKVALMESSIRAAILPQLEKVANASVAVTSSVHNLSAANLQVGNVLSGFDGWIGQVVGTTPKFDAQVSQNLNAEAVKFDAQVGTTQNLNAEAVRTTQKSE